MDAADYSCSHLDHKVTLVDKLQNHEDEERGMVDQQQVVHFDDAAHNALVRIHDGVRGEKDKHCVVERWELLGAAVPK